MTLEKILLVAQVGGRGDRAFDKKHEHFADAVAKYAKSRLETDFAKIPLLEGMVPRRYAVRVLTPEQRAFVRDTSGLHTRALAAVRLGVVWVTTPEGIKKPALEDRGEVGMMAAKEWTQTLADFGGGILLDELAGVVLQRADLGDADEGEGSDPLDSSASPHGPDRVP